jgi:hypothetical protein
MAKAIRSLGGFQLDVKDFERAVITKVKRIGNLIESGLNEGITTWRNKPKWRIVRASYSFEMTTDSLIYIFVNEGTKPHVIKARKSPFLRFRARYKSKTTVGSKTARFGGSFGQYRSVKSVKHPGSAPREFTKLIANEAQAASAGFDDLVNVLEVRLK